MVQWVVMRCRHRATVAGVAGSVRKAQPKTPNTGGPSHRRCCRHPEGFGLNAQDGGHPGVPASDSVGVVGRAAVGLRREDVGTGDGRTADREQLLSAAQLVAPQDLYGCLVNRGRPDLMGLGVLLNLHTLTREVGLAHKDHAGVQVDI